MHCLLVYKFYPKCQLVATEGAEIMLLAEGIAFQSTYLSPPSFFGDFSTEPVYGKVEWN